MGWIFYFEQDDFRSELLHARDHQGVLIKTDSNIVIASIPAYTYDYVHSACDDQEQLAYIHGFAGQELAHESFFKDWQGMVRGFLEAKVRDDKLRDITVVGIEGGPCSMEEADLMPQLLLQIRGNLVKLGRSDFTLRWRYYLSFSEFQDDITRWKERRLQQCIAFEMEEDASHAAASVEKGSCFSLRAVLGCVALYLVLGFAWKATLLAFYGASRHCMIDSHCSEHESSCANESAHLYSGSCAHTGHVYCVRAHRSGIESWFRSDLKSVTLAWWKTGGDAFHNDGCAKKTAPLPGIHCLVQPKTKSFGEGCLEDRNVFRTHPSCSRRIAEGTCAHAGFAYCTRKKEAMSLDRAELWVNDDLLSRVLVRKYDFAGDGCGNKTAPLLGQFHCLPPNSGVAVCVENEKVLTNMIGLGCTVDKFYEGSCRLGGFFYCVSLRNSHGQLLEKWYKVDRKSEESAWQWGTMMGRGRYEFGKFNNDGCGNKSRPLPASSRLPLLAPSRPHSGNTGVSTVPAAGIPPR